MGLFSLATPEGRRGQDGTGSGQAGGKGLPPRCHEGGGAGAELPPGQTAPFHRGSRPGRPQPPPALRRQLYAGCRRAFPATAARCHGGGRELGGRQGTAHHPARHRGGGGGGERCRGGGVQLAKPQVREPVGDGDGQRVVCKSPFSSVCAPSAESWAAPSSSARREAAQSRREQRGEWGAAGAQGSVGRGIRRGDTARVAEVTGRNPMNASVKCEKPCWSVCVLNIQARC